MAPPCLIRFIYTPSYIIFIDKNNYLKDMVDDIIAANCEKMISPGACLFFVLDFVMSKDLEKINSLQQNLIQLELSIFNDKMNTLIRDITTYRSKPCGYTTITFKLKVYAGAWLMIQRD